MSLRLLSLLSLLAGARAAKDGLCLLYASDATRSFYFSGVTPTTGALNPQLLNFQQWDALLLGLAAGEDEDTLFVVPEGVGADLNMTIATLTTSPNGTAAVSYATLGPVPGFDVPGAYTYMNTLHLDASRGQMVAMLEGTEGPPPAAAAAAARSGALRDPGDFFLVLADVFPANGTVSRVLVDLGSYDMRWGSGVLSGVSALSGDDATYYVNPVAGNVPSGQAVYGFPLNGSAPVVVPFGADANLDHLFYSAAQGGLLAVTTDGKGAPTLSRFAPPPAPAFTPIFAWNTSGGLQDWGVFDVTPDGSKLLSVLVDAQGESPRLVVLDLVNLKELARVPLTGFSSQDTLCDVAWCNVN